jgi:hypothetical protein
MGLWPSNERLGTRQETGLKGKLGQIITGSTDNDEGAGLGFDVQSSREMSEKVPSERYRW